jgi:hypothetical protein
VVPEKSRRRYDIGVGKTPQSASWQVYNKVRSTEECKGCGFWNLSQQRTNPKGYPVEKCTDKAQRFPSLSPSLNTAYGFAIACFVVPAGSANGKPKPTMNGPVCEPERANQLRAAPKTVRYPTTMPKYSKMGSVGKCNASSANRSSLAVP